MELITQLIVKDFPWVIDWTYKFSQDTVISWRSNSWKTSLLKAITWLLSWKDLQWKTIPNIKNTTSITIRWENTFTRQWFQRLVWNLHSLLIWSSDEILSRIIPWYILQGALSNKKIIEITTEIDMDNRYIQIPSNLLPKKYTNNLKWLWEYIALLKKWRRILEDVSYKMWDFHSLMGQLGHNVTNLIIDFISITELITLWLNDLHRELGTVVNYRSPMKDNNDYKKELQHRISFSVSTLKEKCKLSPLFDTIIKEELNIDLNKDNVTLGELSTIKDFIQVVHHTWGRIFSIFGKMNSPKNISATLKAYNILINENSLLSRLKDIQNESKVSLYQSVNEKLKLLWMSLSWNNILSYNVVHEWEKKSLFELSSTDRFLYEVQLCSNIQTQFLEQHGRYSDTNSSWLLLIDNCLSKNTADEVDKILTQWHNHQVFLVIPDNNNLKIKID